MKLSYSTLACPGWDRGYLDCAEVVDSPRFRGEALREAAARLRDAGLAVSCLSSGARMSAPDVAARAKSLDAMRRYADLCAPLGCRFYAKAGKPGTGALRRAMEDAGAEPGNSLCLGDQLLTDCAAGRRLGMTVFIVPPIRDKTTLFWRIKRGIEKPYMKKFAALRMKQGEAEIKQTKANTK